MKHRHLSAFFLAVSLLVGQAHAGPPPPEIPWHETKDGKVFLVRGALVGGGLLLMGAVGGAMALRDKFRTRACQAILGAVDSFAKQSPPPPVPRLFVEKDDGSASDHGPVRLVIVMANGTVLEVQSAKAMQTGKDGNIHPTMKDKAVEALKLVPDVQFVRRGDRIFAIVPPEVVSYRGPAAGGPYKPAVPREVELGVINPDGSVTLDDNSVAAHHHEGDPGQITIIPWHR